LSYVHDPDIQAVFFDIDGTLTSGGDVWEALLKSPDVNPVRKSWLYISALPHYQLSKIGLLSQAGFRDRWVRLMAWLMTGWADMQVGAIFDQIMQGHLVLTLRPDIVAILKQHKAQGHPVVLVSTMLDGMVSRLVEHLGADAGLGSRLEMRNGRCAGRVVGQTCSGARKVDFVHAYLAEYMPGVSFDTCAAYADSHSDIPLLAGSGYPVATYPDELMRAAAVERGWRIYEGDA
jgi:HAD superfamily hydrolase (TIGR01490 family)